MLAVTESGGSLFQSRGSLQQAQSQVVLVFNPDEPHSGKTLAGVPWAYRGFYLEQPALDWAKNQLGITRDAGFGSNVILNPGLAADLRVAHQHFESGQSQQAGAQLLMLLARMYGSHASIQIPLCSSRHDAAVTRPALELISDCFANDELTLAQMAAAAGVTQFRLITAFKRSLGMTPHAWLQQQRMESARRLLRAGASISEAALQANFYDQSALNRCFKRSYGITPGQYRQAYR